MADPSEIALTVFTKHWQGWDPGALADHFATLEVDGVEVPVRDGMDVEPHTAAVQLPRHARAFSAAGLTVATVAAEPSALILEACAAAGVSAVRTMAPIGDDGYLRSVARLREQLLGLAEVCSATGVRILVQQHTGRYVSSTSGLRALLEGLPPEWIQAAWDTGHSGLAAEAPDLAIEQIADRLGQVSVKSARYTDVMNTPGWSPQWVRAVDGLNDWSAIADALRGRSFAGTYCLSAEYTSEINREGALRDDVAFARQWRRSFQ